MWRVNVVINVYVCVVFLCKCVPAAAPSVMAGVCFLNETMRGAGNVLITHRFSPMHANKFTKSDVRTNAQ